MNTDEIHLLRKKLDQLEQQREALIDSLNTCRTYHAGEEWRYDTQQARADWLAHGNWLEKTIASFSLK